MDDSIFEAACRRDLSGKMTRSVRLSPKKISNLTQFIILSSIQQWVMGLTLCPGKGTFCQRTRILDPMTYATEETQCHKTRTQSAIPPLGPL